MGLGEPSIVKNERNSLTFYIPKVMDTSRLAYKRLCLYNKIRDASLHFKKDMTQLVWIMKEFN